MADDVVLPRLNEFTEDLVRAWLYPAEEKILDAIECSDLSVTYTISVCLLEDRAVAGRRKRKAKLPEEERHRRERAAGAMIRARSHGLANVDRILVALASVRRRAHYAELGVKAPVLPGEVSDG